MRAVPVYRRFRDTSMLLLNLKFMLGLSLDRVGFGRVDPYIDAPVNRQPSSQRFRRRGDWTFRS